MRSRLATPLCALLLSIPLVPVTACTGADPEAAGELEAPELSGQAFEAISRPTSDQELAARQAALAPFATSTARSRVRSSGTFYLAVKKSALQERWFLSAFLEQHFPGAVVSGAAVSLGTRVVSFKPQNGRLYVFNVDDRATSSDVFDPELIVDAYPIVEERLFHTPNGFERYVVIDPAAGLNRFNFVSDWKDRDGTRFETELAFSQEFRPTADGGATWQMVFTGYADKPIEEAPAEPNRFHAAGTLGMALRPYREGSHYREVPMAAPGTAPDREFYFRSPQRIVPNTAEVTTVAAHWDIYPGMQPIEWLITRSLQELDDTPPFASYDLVDAVKRGVEGWNTAFGFPVFTARLETEGESFWQDDRNYIIFDPATVPGHAFANWRSNPNTGEVRGATVYLNSIWFKPERFQDDPSTAAEVPADDPPAPMKRLTWEGMPSEPLCVLTPDHVHDALPDEVSARYTAKEKFERTIGRLILHETGHTLGLRHNFKGTLLPPSSSVMDYMNDAEKIALGFTPGAYDVAAVRYLYGLSTDVPTQPFCTDSAIGTDPTCATFDASANPLVDYHPGRYTYILDRFYLVGNIRPLTTLTSYAGGLVQYAATGTADQAQLAWQTLIAKVGAPIPADKPPAYQVGSNVVLAWILDSLATKHHATLHTQLIDQAQLVTRNVDGIRAPELRRRMIDLLKQLQTFDAFEALLALRSELNSSLSSGGLDRIERLVVEDLVARITVAVTPYFVR